MSRLVRKGVGGKKSKYNMDSENMGLRNKNTTWGVFTDELGRLLLRDSPTVYYL